MKQHRAKEITVELNEETYEKFKEYCVETDSEKSEIMEDLVTYFLNECMNTMDAMRKGYAEMGHINLEISSEFSECEVEAHCRYENSKLLNEFMN